ncbi:heparan-alpha-glucosaminide N-acetyltransferase domain-containing protein [Ornithinimicrobium cerasi]|uniref:heparan-alpha-glucosaminide N-acetyltransferase domain-containing protein n=1 Tax=Ornithinimicrobium cerasi TaxID=2248773 RepID=UPI00137B49C1|nr:heparan-alpha-glucosaminide N-acetyltransferase domain-containing protein [Ornithinimicrobium cerasi]
MSGAARLGGTHSRLVSLDAARGIFLTVSVTSASVIPPVPSWLEHPAWFGVTFYDLIFPLFVTLSGVGLAFAYRRRTSWRTTARRVGVLLVVGVVYTAVHGNHYELGSLRLTGVLQLYAVLVLASALLHTVVRDARGWAVITLATAVLGTLAYVWFEARCPGAVLAPTCNPSGVIDGALLGDHMYAQGERRHDPEGLVAICGAFLTASAGTTAGHLALEARAGSRRVGLVRIAAWTATCAATGTGLAMVVEPFKRLWTPSFALLAGALGLAVFLVAFAVLDVLLERVRGARTRDAVGWPLVALGRNSLLVYFGSHLGSALLLRYGGEPSWAEQAGEAVSWEGSAQVGFALLSLVVWWAVALGLHRRGIYVRP